MGNEDDESSSPSSNISITETNDSGDALSRNMSRASKKPRAGRKKFKETRHHVFRGVRKRNESKWICEVRKPKKKSKIWLGTFPAPEMAARAHNVAALALRGEKANLNFPDSAWRLKRAKSSSVHNIQVAAVEAAGMFHPSNVPFSSSSFSIDFQANTSEFGGIVGPLKKESPNVETESNLRVPSLTDSAHRNDGLGPLNPPTAMFMDEEVLFDMPSFYNSMAEGLVITPPGMARGYDWGIDHDHGCDHMDLTLWRH